MPIGRASFIFLSLNSSLYSDGWGMLIKINLRSIPTASYKIVSMLESRFLLSKVRGAVQSRLVFCYCITNYQKLKSLKQHPFIISQFLWGQEFRHSLVESTVHCLRGLQSKYRLELRSPLRPRGFSQVPRDFRIHSLDAIELVVDCFFRDRRRRRSLTRDPE